MEDAANCDTAEISYALCTRWVRCWYSSGDTMLGMTRYSGFSRDWMICPMVLLIWPGTILLPVLTHTLYAPASLNPSCVVCRIRLISIWILWSCEQRLVP